MVCPTRFKPQKHRSHSSQRTIRTRGFSIDPLVLPFQCTGMHGRIRCFLSNQGYAKWLLLIPRQLGMLQCCRVGKHVAAEDWIKASLAMQCLARLLANASAPGPCEWKDSGCSLHHLIVLDVSSRRAFVLELGMLSSATRSTALPCKAQMETLGGKPVECRCFVDKRKRNVPIRHVRISHGATRAEAVVGRRALAPPACD